VSYLKVMTNIHYIHFNYSKGYDRMNTIQRVDT
jgi:hypothetical protein